MGPYRRLIALTASGMLLILGFLFVTSGGHPVLAVACGLDIAVLIACRLDRRREQRLLLGDDESVSLPGLEYRSTGEAIEFVWKSDGAHRPVRVLRSETRFPETADDAWSDRSVEVVFEGDGERFVDSRTKSLTDYRYTFFVGSEGTWTLAARAWVDAGTPLDTFVAAGDGGAPARDTERSADVAGRPSTRAVARADDWRR